MKMAAVITNNQGSEIMSRWEKLVKTVANSHGGKILLKSNEKEGTTFTLLLHKFSHKPGKIRTELNFSEN